MKKISVLLLMITLLSGCYPAQQTSTYEYLTLYPPASIDKDAYKKIKSFLFLYNNLDKGSVASITDQTYAESLYFNDTLVTLHTRPELIEYLENTQKRLQAINISALNVLEKDQDVFVHWKMQTGFTLMGKRHDVESLGISHLRFNPQGKIILHQDYWDSTSGFFQHIPLIGGIIKWIKLLLQ